MKGQKGLAYYAFWLGAILSVLVGIGSAANLPQAQSQWVPVLLVVLGLIVGFVNISARETVAFLVAAIAILAFGASGLSTLNTLIPKLGTLLGSGVQAFGFFVGSAAIVVAVKEAWNLAE